MQQFDCLILSSFINIRLNDQTLSHASLTICNWDLGGRLLWLSNVLISWKIICVGSFLLMKCVFVTIIWCWHLLVCIYHNAGVLGLVFWMCAACLSRLLLRGQRSEQPGDTSHPLPYWNVWCSAGTDSWDRVQHLWCRLLLWDWRYSVAFSASEPWR